METRTMHYAINTGLPVSRIDRRGISKAVYANLAPVYAGNCVAEGC